MSVNPAALAAALAGDIENALVAAAPGGIAAQEKRGQQALVASTDMPLDLSPSREAFEKVGFTFGDPIDGIFQAATLPAGWTRQGTEHAMHSTILDAKGRQRVSVFYKAAFYDRLADAALLQRYKIDTGYPGYDGELCAGLAEGQARIAVLDGEHVIHEQAIVGDRDFEAAELERAAAREWLAARFPDHADPTAYWDD